MKSALRVTGLEHGINDNKECVGKPPFAERRSGSSPTGGLACQAAPQFAEAFALVRWDLWGSYGSFSMSEGGPEIT